MERSIAGRFKVSLVLRPFRLCCSQCSLCWIGCAAFTENQAAAPPLNICHCFSEVAADYTKKQNVLRLRFNDGSEYLFEFHSAEEMTTWLSKIQYYASTWFLLLGLFLSSSGCACFAHAVFVLVCSVEVTHDSVLRVCCVEVTRDIAQGVCCVEVTHDIAL